MSTPAKNGTSPRVRRGGGWGDCVPSWVRAASRLTYQPAYRNDIIGFRCVLRGRQPLKVTL